MSAPEVCSNHSETLGQTIIILLDSAGERRHLFPWQVAKSFPPERRVEEELDASVAETKHLVP